MGIRFKRESVEGKYRTVIRDDYSNIVDSYDWSRNNTNEVNVKNFEEEYLIINRIGVKLYACVEVEGADTPLFIIEVDGIIQSEEDMDYWNGRTQELKDKIIDYNYDGFGDFDTGDLKDGFYYIEQVFEKKEDFINGNILSGYVNEYSLHARDKGKGIRQFNSYPIELDLGDL